MLPWLLCAALAAAVLILCLRLWLLHRAMDSLEPRERKIITLRFGLDGREERTQKEVADVMGISQSYISRLEKRIIQRLKKEMLRLM